MGPPEANYSVLPQRRRAGRAGLILSQRHRAHRAELVLPQRHRAHRADLVLPQRHGAHRADSCCHRGTEHTERTRVATEARSAQSGPRVATEARSTQSGTGSCHKGTDAQLGTNCHGRHTERIRTLARDYVFFVRAPGSAERIVLLSRLRKGARHPSEAYPDRGGRRRRPWQRRESRADVSPGSDGSHLPGSFVSATAAYGGRPGRGYASGGMSRGAQPASLVP